MSDRYQTTVAGRFVIQPASANLFDHVVTARASATRGETAWIKCRTDPTDALEFKVHNGRLHVTPFACKVGWIHAWNDVPAWMTEARTINDRLSAQQPAA